MTKGYVLNSGHFQDEGRLMAKSPPTLNLNFHFRVALSPMQSL